MRIGIFGGTFNPIHLGHLRCAEEVREKLKLDKVIFIPAGKPPLKNFDIIDSKHRFIMTKLAIQKNPFFEISDFELKRKETSYTINTLDYFKRLYQNDTLFFIMGVDTFLELKKWYKPEEILRMMDLIVMPRPGFDLKELENSEFIEKKASKNCYKIKNSSKKVFYLTITPFYISSSEIRKIIRKGKSIRYLVEEEVREYIERNNLYKE